MKGRGMTSLRLFESTAPAEDATTDLFDTPAHSVRYRQRGWSYATSMILHVIATTSLVIVVRHFTPPPPLPPLPPPPSQNIAHPFVFNGLRVDLKRPPGVRKTQRSPRAPIVVPGEAAPAPLPSARNDSRVAETKAIVDDPPVKIAFDPPIQAANNAHMVGRHG